MRLSTLVVLVLLIACVAYGQRRNRNRSRGRGGKAKNNCHLKEVEKCIDSLSKLGKGDNPSQIIATSEGVDKMCSATKTGFIGCIKNYFKKCGSPLHQEVSGLFVDQLTTQANKFCNKGPEREKFLQNSPCLHEKVFSQKPVKEDCNSRYSAALSKVTSEKLNKLDDATNTVCCGYRYWTDCTTKLIEPKCGANGISAYNRLITHGFLGFPDLLCPSGLFDPFSDFCKKFIPPVGARVKFNFTEAGAGKYNVANLFSFLFKID